MLFIDEIFVDVGWLFHAGLNAQGRFFYFSIHGLNSELLDDWITGSFVRLSASPPIRLQRYHIFKFPVHFPV